MKLRNTKYGLEGEASTRLGNIVLIGLIVLDRLGRTTEGRMLVGAGIFSLILAAYGGQ